MLSRLRAVLLPASRVEAGLRNDGFEQLHGIARWVLDENLLAANPCHDLVAKPDSRLAKGFHGGHQIGDLYGEPVPSAWFLVRAIWHWLSPACRRIRCAQHQP